MPLMFREESFRIHTTECDFKTASLRMSSALDIFQDIAWANAEEIGVGFDNTYNLGYYWVVMYEQMEVVSKLPEAGENIIVKTWPKPRGRLEFEREYEICDKDGNVLITGISNWVLIDKVRRTISKGSNVVFDGKYIDRTNYVEKQKRKLDLNDDNYDSVYTYKVLLSDIDRNNHLNNAKYMDIIYNMRGTENYKSWKKVEIAFLHEAKLDDEISVRHFIVDGKDCYKGYANGIACFEAILTMEE